MMTMQNILCSGHLVASTNGKASFLCVSWCFCAELAFDGCDVCCLYRASCSFLCGCDNTGSFWRESGAARAAAIREKKVRGKADARCSWYIKPCTVK